MSKAIIECVPNFSEGVDTERVLAIVRAMQVPGVSLLDWSQDADHNRSVVTIAGPPAAVVEAAVLAAGKAAELIDLTRQTGVHPRIGAADVIPFVPVRDISWSIVRCWRGRPARRSGAAMACRCTSTRLPRPDPTGRGWRMSGRGSSRGYGKRRGGTLPRRPDVGGPDLHPTAGASAVGARRFLIAWNVFLDKPDVALARALAREVRDSGGGLKGVKALGALVRGRAQISMNLTDFRVNSPSAVFEDLKRRVEGRGARIVEGELIGLIPEAAVEQNSEWVRQLEDFSAEGKILERRMERPLEWP